jgi:protocatechuate 4,5-dioxygenase beta chain
MAIVVGGIGVSHVPAIGGAIAKNLIEDAYWRPFFSGVCSARTWVEQVKPDLVVVVYNDHGLNFFLDKMPTFAIGAAHADEGWCLPVQRPVRGDARASWKLIEQLVADEFDVTTCQEMLVDHAFVIPMQLLWPDGDAPPAIPVAVNTVQHPLPSVARCLKLGKSLGRAIAGLDADKRVLVLGTGGLSHQLDGQRAGFINKAFDLEFLDELIAQPETLGRYSIPEIVKLAGTQGVELLMWVAMRGALGQSAKRYFQNYHIPISNTASCVLVLEPQG